MRPLIVLCLLLPAVAAAETAYVTDQLRLGLYANPEFSGSAVRTLVSGEAFEVLSRDRSVARVRLADGTTGYLRAAYIVDEKPATLIVAETRSEADRLAAELAAAREAYADPEVTITALRADVERLTAELAAATGRADELASDNAAWAARSERYKGSLPLSWVGAAALVCLVAGFVAGLWWIDRASRRRHGGIRVY